MNIVVLCGGLSSERDVSMKSGELVASALKTSGHSVVLLDVFMGVKVETNLYDVFENPDKYSVKVEGIPTTEPDLAKVKAQREDKSNNFFGPNIIAICRLADIVFVALHGSDGENGRLQATFDLYDIKYTGSNYLTSAIAMDKAMCKKMIRDLDVPCPAGFTMKRNERSTKLSDVTFPCVVKPNRGGSSIGVSIVQDAAELDEALDSAFKWDTEAVIEDYIKGREFSVAVLDHQALPVIEIAPKSGFYNYANKYAAGAATETCPADIPQEISMKMQLFAERICAGIGVDTYCRIDFLMNDNNEIYFLEVNTLPGMTPTSLMPQEAAEVGISYEELCEEILRVSMNKYL